MAYTVRIAGQTIGPLERPDIERRASLWKNASVEVAPVGTTAFIPLQDFLNPVASTPAPAAGGQAATQPSAPGGLVSVRVNGQVIGPFTQDELRRRSANWLKLRVLVEVAPAGTTAFVPLADSLGASPVATPAPWYSRRTVRLYAGAGAAVFVVAIAAAMFVPRWLRPEYVDVRATLAPNVVLEALPWSRRLPAGGADDFDVSPGGQLVVRIGTRLFDFATGQALTASSQPVGSAAFAGDALTTLTSAGKLAYVDDTGVTEIGAAFSGRWRLQSSTATRGELLLVRDDAPYGLVGLDAGGGVRPLTGTPFPIAVAAGSMSRHVFAAGAELYLQKDAAPAVRVLELPAGDPILGVALRGDDIYFSTRKAVYRIYGGIAMPMAIGVGGALRGLPGGLVVLNAANRRLYRLAMSE